MFSTHAASFEKFAFWFGYPLSCLCLKSYNFTILMHETYDHLKMLQDIRLLKDKLVFKVSVFSLFAVCWIMCGSIGKNE